MKSKKEDQQPLELQLSGRQNRVASSVRVFVRNQIGINLSNSKYTRTNAPVPGSSSECAQGWFPVRVSTEGKVHMV